MPIASSNPRAGHPALFGSRCSIEIVPSGDINTSGLRRLPKGTDIYVASIHGHSRQDIVDLCTQLRLADLEPIPHIAARQLGSRQELEDLLVRLRADADVRNVLLLGGDVEAFRAGPLLSARALLQTDLFARHGIMRVGFATYPEPHPVIGDQILRQELAAKLRIAGEQGLESWLVTQLCFDPDAVIRHVQHLRSSMGIDAPVHVGVAGPTSWKGLARFAKICGVAASARSVMTGGFDVRPLLLGFDPSEIVSRIARSASSRTELGLAGLHFFTFGGPAKTVDWLMSPSNLGGAWLAAHEDSAGTL